MQQALFIASAVHFFAGHGLLGLAPAAVHDPGSIGAWQLAQMTYKGYMSCSDDSTRGNCDVEMNRKKDSIKETCYGVWTGNWPERSTLDPSTIRLYQGWCREASDDINFAAREFTPLIKYVTKYRRFVPGSASSEEVVNAALNTQYFLNKCSSGSAERAARAMELWGTKEHGNWTVRKLDLSSPSRYREILSACERKSWARKLKEESFPMLAVSWKRQFDDLSSVSCSALTPGQAWTTELVDEKAGLVKKLQALRLQTITLKDVSPSPISSNPATVDSLLEELQIKERNCSELVVAGKAEIERQIAEKARQEQQRAAREAEARRQAAARAAAAERRAAAARAAARRQEEAARAAEAAKRRKEAERQRALEQLDQLN